MAVERRCSEILPPPGKKARIVSGSSQAEETETRVMSYDGDDDDKHLKPFYASGVVMRDSNYYGDDEYLKQFYASDGFDIDVYPTAKRIPMNSTLPMFPEQLAENIGFLTRLSQLALEVFNSLNNTNYKVVEVVRTTFRVCAGFEYNITFEAVEDATPDGEAEDATNAQAEDATDAQVENAIGGHAKIFQASVWDGIGKQKVILCRLKTKN